MQLFELVAQTLGFVQFASKPMELAQSQFVCFQQEVVEAKKDLVSVKQKWEGSGVDSGSGTQSHDHEGKQDYSSATDFDELSALCGQGIEQLLVRVRAQLRRTLERH